MRCASRSCYRAGLVDEAYKRYGLHAHTGATYLATFRAVAKAYPHKQSSEILADLVETTPGDEGKWFAAAKDAGLYDEALELAGRAPCDPKTLTRAARDLTAERPAFAVEAGILALQWLAEGYGYEITGADVWAAYDYTIKAAEKRDAAADVRARIRQVVSDRPGGMVLPGPRTGARPVESELASTSTTRMGRQAAENCSPSRSALLEWPGREERRFAMVLKKAGGNLGFLASKSKVIGLTLDFRTARMPPLNSGAWPQNCYRAVAYCRLPPSGGNP